MKTRATHSQSVETPDPESFEDGDRPELVDATHYDFDRLERAVSDLARRHLELSEANQILLATLEEKDSQIQKLESEVDLLGKRRQAALQRLDGLVEELDRLDASLARGGTA